MFKLTSILLRPIHVLARQLSRYYLGTMHTLCHVFE